MATAARCRATYACNYGRVLALHARVDIAAATAHQPSSSARPKRTATAGEELVTQYVRLMTLWPVHKPESKPRLWCQRFLCCQLHRSRRPFRAQTVARDT
eukprot:249209-Pleurochrysis_carterae.AAC.1